MVHKAVERSTVSGLTLGLASWRAPNAYASPPRLGFDPEFRGGRGCSKLSRPPVAPLLGGMVTDSTEIALA